jgi:[calcium/calmodulin-dependent protein kinase] kinase
MQNLGQGSYGKVKLALKSFDGINSRFALKILKKSFLKKKREYYKDPTGGTI